MNQILRYSFKNPQYVSFPYSDRQHFKPTPNDSTTVEVLYMSIV